MSESRDTHLAMTAQERAQAARYGARVYGAYLVLRAAAEGRLSEDRAQRIAVGRLRQQ